MSYIGNEPPDTGAYGVQSFDGGGTSFTLSKPSTTATVLLFIDGVRQTPVDAYSVSGVTLTTTATTPSGTDNVTVQFLGDVVDFGEPSDDSVSTAKIQDDAVTAAKLANSINTEIAANTAKVTNATHTGDVTGATALTIATDAVDIAMLSATGTASASTFLRGDNAWAAPAGGGITHASAWRLTTTFTGGVDPIASNLEVNDTSGYASLGAAMTESSGIFTFPATGFWLIKAWGSLYLGSGNSRYVLIQIKTTIDADTGPTWVETGGVMQMVPDSASAHYAGVSNEYIFDVTDTATHKVSFRAGMEGSSVQFIGSSTHDQTYFQFIRLADT